MARDRTSWILILTMLTVIGIGITPGWAEEKYPSQAITSIVPFPAGGGSDAVAHLFAEVIGNILGQKVIVVNKPGGSGSVAASALVRAKPDGYAIGHLSPMASLPEFFKKYFRADYTSDQLAPVAQWSGYPQAVFCKVDKPFRTMKELFDYARNVRVLVGTQGIGLAPELAVRVAEQQEGLDKLKYIPFKGDSEIVVAVKAGHVGVGIVTFSAIVPDVTLGTMRVLAIVTENKLPDFPQIPNFYELGYKTGFRQFYLGTFVPKGTPEGVIKKLESAIDQTAKDKTFSSRMGEIEMPVIYKNSEELSIIMQETQKAYIELGKKGWIK